MPPIGETDNGAFAHAEHFLDDEGGIIQIGQGLAENDAVERLGGIIFQSFLNVALTDT